MGPLSSSYHRSISPTIVLLPDPDGPTKAVIFPAWKRRLRLFRIFIPGLDGYAKLTLFKSISPVADTSGSFSPPLLGFGALMTVWKMAEAPAAREAAEMGAVTPRIELVINITDMRTLVLVRRQAFIPNIFTKDLHDECLRTVNLLFSVHFERVPE